MVISSPKNILSNSDLVNINSGNKSKLKRFPQNGQIQSINLHRGSYSSIIRISQKCCFGKKSTLAIQERRG